MKEIRVYHLSDNSAPIEPARSGRVWMDNTPDRFAYRCLPLAIANAAGWEIFCPHGFTATWNGANAPDAIKVQFDDPELEPFAESHFGHGVLTFHSHLMFRTPEGMSLFVQGSPNEIKHGIQALAGVVETAWLPFTFTMNWKFTAPGTVRFERGEPFAFITPTRLGDLTETVPVEWDIRDDPDTLEAFTTWSISRRDFIERLRAKDPDAVKEGWQRHYMHGKHPDGVQAPAPSDHRTKIRAGKVRKKVAIND